MKFLLPQVHTPYAFKHLKFLEDSYKTPFCGAAPKHDPQPAPQLALLTAPPRAPFTEPYRLNGQATAAAKAFLAAQKAAQKPKRRLKLATTDTRHNAIMALTIPFR